MSSKTPEEQLLHDIFAKPADRFDYDTRTGKFDDVFLSGVDVHIEALGAGEFFIGVYKPDGTQYALNASRARVSWVHVPERESASPAGES